MDKKLTAICIMTISAVALMIANFLTPPPARAEAQAMNRDYQAVTAMIPSGGEGLYIVDNRTGLIAIFTYDPNSRSVVPRAARPVTDAFK
jgi:hypothetical protein